MLSNYLTSLIRTWTPIGVGLLATWAATHWHVVLSSHTSDLLVATVTAALGAGYYALVRAVEHRFPKLGWLLGSPAKPAYGQLQQDVTDLSGALAGDVLGNFTGPDPLAIDGRDPNTPGSSAPAIEQPPAPRPPAAPQATIPASIDQATAVNLSTPQAPPQPPATGQ